jgi:hypothetical protein
LTPTEAIGLFCAGSLVTLVTLLSLAWSRVSGFRLELGGLRLVDRDSSAKDDLATLRSDYVSAIAERDAARAGMDQLEAALREVKNG